MRRPRPARSPSARGERPGHGAPFFIVGAPRSGTGLLAGLLDRHEDLAVPAWTGCIAAFHAASARYGDLAIERNAESLLGDIAVHAEVRRAGLLTDPASIDKRAVTGYADLIDRIYTAYARSRGKRRWGDRVPSYTTEIDRLVRLFPGCRIVHIVRDGRDVALARGIGQLARAAGRWRWETILCHKMGSLLPEQYFLVHFEDLVLDVEHTLQRVCGFLAEEYAPATPGFERAGRVTVLRAGGHPWRAPDPRRALAWKREMSRSDQGLFEHFAADALEMFGYERTGARRTLRGRMRGMYDAIVKRS